MRARAQVHLVFPSSSDQQCLMMMMMSHELGDTCLKPIKCFSQHIRVFPKPIAQPAAVILSEAKSVFCFLWYLESSHRFFVLPVKMFYLCREYGSICLTCCGAQNRAVYLSHAPSMQQLQEVLQENALVKTMEDFHSWKLINGIFHFSDFFLMQLSGLEHNSLVI